MISFTEFFLTGFLNRPNVACGFLEQIAAKFQLQNLLLGPDSLGLGLVVVAGLNSLPNSLLNSLLNSLALMKEWRACCRAPRASIRWGGRGVCSALWREDLDKANISKNQYILEFGAKYLTDPV